MSTDILLCGQQAVMGTIRVAMWRVQSSLTLTACVSGTANKTETKATHVSVVSRGTVP